MENSYALQNTAKNVLDSLWAYLRRDDGFLGMASHFERLVHLLDGIVTESDK